MLAPCHGRRSRAAGRHGSRWLRAALGLVGGVGLAGCAELPGGGGAWGFVSLAMLLVAAAAYAVGALRAQAAAARELRQVRAENLRLGALHETWLWHTDSAGQPVSWQPPGQAPLPGCALLEHPVLRERLQARQAFTGLRLRLAQAQDGSHGWELRAAPRHDDLGQFSGFTGAARPTDASHAQALAAAALQPALEAHGAPALLVVDSGSGFRVQQFNVAAASAWPGLAEGLALDAAAQSVAHPAMHPAVHPAAPAGTPLPALAPVAVPQLPAALLPALAEGSTAEVDGWQVRPLPRGEGLPRAVLLTRQPTALPGQDAGSAESDNFSFTVSHDLRAPIRVVDGFTRIVKEDYGRLLDRVGNDHLDRVLGAAARMNLMIDALLTLARLSSQPLARQPVNLSQLAGYVVDDLRRGAPEREVEVEIEPDLLTQGDPTLLRLVLENLLGNAWKYSARVSRTQIMFCSVPGGTRATYLVRDNGAGFDMRSSDRLFGLFQRLHSTSEFPGHGVGLASVRRIVRRHGGEIWAEAEPGRGASFYFTLAG